MLGAAGDLIVRLGAHTSQFDKKMRGSQKTLGRLGGAVGGLSKRLIGLSAGFLGVAGMGGMAMTIKRNLELMDSTAKLADRIGITTEKLQGLRHAAELTGAGADTLDAGLTTMAKRLGEAARGAGAATPALKHIGLAIEDIIALSPDQQFIAIAEAISRLPTATERAAAAANIFSKGNMALINTLAEGREGIEAMISEAERLGKTFSRDMAAGAEKANDAIEKLKVRLSGFSVEVTSKMAPSITAFADALREIPDALMKFNIWMLKAEVAMAKYVPFYRTAMGGAVTPQYITELEKEIEYMQRELRGEKAPPGAPQGPPAKPPGWPSQDLETMFGPQAAKGGGGAGKDFWTRYFDDLERRGTEVNKLWRMVETPMERYQRQMQELGSLGKIPEGLRNRVQAQYWQEYKDQIERMQPPPEPAAAAAAAAAQGPRHAAAAERGSPEAWNRLLTAMGGGKKGPEEKTAKNTDKIAKDLAEAVQIWRRNEDRAGDQMEIPPA